MKFTQRLLVLGSLLLAVAPVLADSALIREVRHEFSGRLPAIERAVPGYERPATRAPGLAVGDFLPADDSLQIWSRAIGSTLRRRIQYVPSIKLRMPHPPFTGIDTAVDSDPRAPLLATPAHFKGLHATLGIETVLTGTLGRDGDEFVIDAALVDSVSGEQRAGNSWRATSESLPAAIIAISSWVYDELGVDLAAAERAYLEDPATLRADALEAFVANYEDLSLADMVVRQELSAELREAYPHFAPFVTYEMYARAYPTNLSEVRAQLEGSKQARRDFPGNAGVVASSYAHVPFDVLEEHEKTRHLDALRVLVVENPDDPMTMIDLAATYGKNGDYFSALAVILEATERWPDYYRTWWVLGNLVNERAWQVRGTGLWREIPTVAQDRFRLLSFIADRITDKAISMHGKNGLLWQTKINGIGSREGYSARLMAAFEAGAKVAPHHEPIYSNALNFAQNKWGGNASARRRIITLAEENNPDASWPKFLRSNHEADFVGLEGLADALTDEFKRRRILENPVFWQILFGVIAGIMALSIWISMRRTRRAMAADTDGYGYRRYRDEGRPVSRELTPEEKLRQVRRQRR